VNFAFSALTPLGRHQKERPACKKLNDEVLERDANDLHIIQLMPLPPSCFSTSAKEDM